MGGDTVTFIEQTGRPYLPKPFTPDVLITIVREALRQMGKETDESAKASFFIPQYHA
ncbi:hypothetical protein ACFLV6_02230 [Chloroflexota bacterium]